MPPATDLVEVELAHTQENQSRGRFTGRYLVSLPSGYCGQQLTVISTVIVSCISMYYRVQIFSGIDSTWNTPAVYATTYVTLRMHATDLS
jgi:hypothetical protein